MDMLAAMGISGFGKKPKLRQLDPKRFEKNKREETVRHSSDTLRCMSLNHSTWVHRLRLL